MSMKTSRVVPASAFFVLLVFMTVQITGQEGAQNSAWVSYGADLKNTRYSPLAQINRENFNTLEIAWRFSAASLGPRPEFNFESTPLMVGGALYTTAGSRRAVVALDPASGEMFWMYRLDEGKRGEAAPRRLSGRGLTYWADSAGPRIFYVTPGYQLVALDANTGDPIREFGTNGIVDLKQGLDQDVDLITGDIGLHAAPIVSRGVIVVGAAHLPGSAPKTKENVKGYVRGFDARTGTRRWIFHTIPQGDEFGNNTWLNDSWRYTGNSGVWGQSAIDEELGYVYLPVEDATGDYYGGHRPGNNLFSSGLVAVNIQTGERVWHYQFVHHDIWDFDLPCAPVLVDITVNGRAIKAVAQPSKQAFLYVLDRVTGQPVWPIEERPVPKGDVPGEWYAPTQPFPTKPPAFDRQGIGIDDLIDFTPELKAEAVKLVSRYRMGPLFTPPSVSVFDGTLGTLHVPAADGGVNWPGASLDPETGIIYIYSKTQVSTFGLINDPKRSNMDFIQGRATAPATAGAGGAGAAAAPAGGGPGGGGGGEGGGGVTVQGLPLLKPPWARITAIDLNRGEIVWQVPHGETPDNVRNHEALRGVDIPRTGRVGRIGTLTTKTLVIAGEAGFATTPSGQRGAMLRAYDKATGRGVGAVYMPAPQTGSPMTYMLNGTQYIVLAISGGGFPGELIAFRLPPPAPQR
jgi:quinoprotein glucose dehydrogenase